MNKDNIPYFPYGTIHKDEFFETNQLKFVWDKAKNQHNIEDHGIDFRTAALVFNDPYAISDYDDFHSEYEDRNTEVGTPVDPEDVIHIPGFDDIPRAVLGEIDNVIFVVYTVRLIKNAEYYRIISARAAEKDEIEAYREYRKLADKW